ARARGVGKFLCIGVDAANAPVVKGLAEQYGDVWCSVGIHPLDLSRNDPAGLDWLLTELTHPRVLAIGETGLDDHHEPESAPLLREADLPNTGVLHCFTEDWDMARAALDMGYYISLSGIVTFRNADALRDVARRIPADRLLVETDSPYLAPVPHRGKSNEPQFV